jgi:beta-glucanase (GH16 family)
MIPKKVIYTRLLTLLSATILCNASFSQCNELVWADEFDYTGLPDNSKWTFEVGGGGWGNNELEYYTDKRLENARVADGVLTIEARKESFGGREYTSARMVSRQKGDWLYGRIEVRAKLPSGIGTWPAIWMMPTESAYGGWPNSGEIDIMEHVGYDPNVVHASIHTDAYNWPEGTQKSSTLTVADVFNTFHVYALEWSPQKIDVYVDNTKYFTFMSSQNYQEWPFDKQFYLILNIAVGGNWGGVQGVDDAAFPTRMEIDYVRVYQDADNLKIQGKNEVFKNEQTTHYSLMAEEGRTFNWTVPDGATVVSGQGSNSILVDWDCDGGNVLCHLTTGCDNYDLELPVTLKDYALDGPYFVNDHQNGLQLAAPNLGGTQYTWSLPDDAALVDGQGNDTLHFNWGVGQDTVKLTIENSCGTEELFRILRYYGQYPYPDPDQPHIIPGTISPELFDYGGEGVAYHDATNGNSGSGPRGDESVDTEINGTEVNIGWIDNGEWLEYSIQVQQAGSYYFSALTASPNATSTGPLKVLVNGVTKVNSLGITYTGSWSSFASTAAKSISLATTDTLLRIEMGSGGFNLGQIRLEDHLPTEIPEIQENYLLIYPVPVSELLFIRHSRALREIRITDITGVLRHIGTFGDQETTQCTVDVSGLPAGIYFLSLTDDHNNLTVKKIVKTAH